MSNVFNLCVFPSPRAYALRYALCDYDLTNCIDKNTDYAYSRAVICSPLSGYFK